MLVPNSKFYVRTFLLTILSVALSAVDRAQDSTAIPPRMTAVRTTGSIRIDGRLDEPDWQRSALSVSFTQREPHEGEPVSEKTEIRILYDDRNLYIGFRCWDSDVSKIVANEMRRDATLLDNDCVTIVLDTYHDHRTAFCFATNPLGVQRDGIITADVTDEEQNWDWNGVWENASSIDSLGWTAEIAIPFQTLRFQKGDSLIWGANFSRMIPRNREEAYWSVVLRDYGWAGKYRISTYGHLDGLQGIKQPGDSELKPFVLLGGQRDFEKQSSYDLKRTLGLDAKYHLTPNLTADISVNTDFAQVEADQEQTNLTRFELLFPEKRDFFLEGASIFRFGERTGSPMMPASFLFFSRRIGLSSDNTLIPLLGGVKVTGKAGGLNIGFLDMTGDRSTYLNDNDEQVSEPRTNFGVLRVRQDILANSSVGLIAMNKQSLDNGAYNRNIGVDANIYLTPNLQLGGFFAKTFSPGLDGNDGAAYGDVYYSDDMWTLLVNHNTIEDNFNPEMGYFPRTGIRKTEVSFGISPRPKILNLRQVALFNDFYYITNQQNGLEERYNYTGFWSQFEDGSAWIGIMSWNLEHLTDVFEVHDSVNILPGTYRFANAFTEFDSDKSRSLSGSLTGTVGQFYDGTIVGFGLGLNIKVGAHWTWNLRYERNAVEVSAGRFTDNIFGSRITYTFTPKLFAKAFIQWNSDKEEILANMLLNFIHTPGSDLFLVYNEDVTTHSGSISSRDRTILLKFTYLFNL